ncbi:dephospho-CoA kinase [Alkalihalobacillus sp. CinArs1]|uniref:dephospho-CoA kinase n=1 Tax=Alkalihalobacillus sp. CinArs1 TaxID=2995314 RepID=UPI0022DD5771|nr:dephospho-CoA kinase [Alkalihalobacillus sp. CinArs1]
MKIGLTGGIASGKSTVAEMLRTLSIPVIDADVIAREVVEPGEPALEEIVRVFGEEVRTDDGYLDRKRLGSVIFSNNEKRSLLNEIMHPAIRKRMLAEAKAYEESGHKHVVLDIPLLFESKLSYLVDRTLVVYVDSKTQLERLIERDKSSKEEAVQRIRSQIPIEEKRQLADKVIDNTGTREATEKQLRNILKEWKIV